MKALSAFLFLEDEQHTFQLSYTVQLLYLTILPDAASHAKTCYGINVRMSVMNSFEVKYLPSYCLEYGYVRRLL